MARINGFLVVYIVGCAMMTDSTTAFLYSVGGEAGWTVPDHKTTFFQDWAKNKTFFVGDEIIFMYTSGHNDVFRVSKKEYDKCNSNDPMEAYLKGPTALTLTVPGDYYYFSNIGLHCEHGMKVHITVIDHKHSDDQKLPNSRRLLEVASTSPSPSTTTTTTAPAPGHGSGAPLPAVKQRGIIFGVVFSLAITNFMLSLSI